MCQQSIVTRLGTVWTGELVEHLGRGIAGIDVDGKRYVGIKITRQPVEANGRRFHPVYRTTVEHTRGRL